MEEQPLRVLLVDDEEGVREPLATWLRTGCGYAVDAVSTGEQALELVRQRTQPYDAAIVDDAPYPDPAGIDQPLASGLLEALKTHSPATEVIVLTSGNDRGLAALRAGAHRYLRKPFDRELLAVIVERAAEHERLVAAARDRARVEQQFAHAEHQAQQLRTLRDAALWITEMQDRDDLMNKIINAAVDLLRTRDGGVHEYLADRGELPTIADAHRPEQIGLTLKVGEGMAGRLVGSNEPFMIVSNYQDWDGRAAVYADDDRGPGAVLEVPMQWRDDRIGVLYVEDDVGREFTEDDADQLRMFADQAAIALVNSRLLQGRDIRIKTLEYLGHAAEQLARATDVPHVLRQIGRSAQEVLQADATIIWSYDTEFQPDESVATDLPDDIWQELRQAVVQRDSTSARVIKRRYVAVTDIADPRHRFITAATRRLLDRAGIRGFQGIALNAGDEVVGVLYVMYARRQALGEEAKEIIETFAKHAALALSKARLLQEQDELLAQIRQLGSQVGQLRNAVRDAADATASPEPGAESRSSPRLREETLDDLTQRTLTALGCDAVVLYVYDEISGEFSLPPRMAGVLHPERQQSNEETRDFSLVESVLQEGRLISVEKIAEYAPFRDRRFVRDEKIKSCVAIPLRSPDGPASSTHPVGVMFVNYRRPQRFTPQRLTNIELFANQAAVAIWSAQQYDALERTRVHFDALHAASKSITARLGTDMNSFLRDIAMQSVNCIVGPGGPKAYLGTIQIYDKATDKFEIQQIYTRRDIPPAQVERSLIRPLDRQLTPDGRIGITGRAIKQKRTQLVDDVRQDDEYVEVDAETRSELAVPLLHQGEVMGVLNVESNQLAAFDEEDQRTLEALAGLAVVAIATARQNERLGESRRPPRVDTGLWIDEANREVWLDGSAVQLSRKERDVLLYLYESNGKLCPRRNIAVEALDVAPEDYDQSEVDRLDAIVGELRRKLQAGPSSARYIVTVRGQGFRLDLPARDSSTAR